MTSHCSRVAKKQLKVGTSKSAAHDRRARFVEAMVLYDDNATRAAEAVGYKPGRAAEQTGYRMSKDVVVRQMLAQRRSERLDRAKATSDEVIISATRDIRFDPAKLYNEDGSMKRIHELDEDTRLALRGMEVNQITVGKGNEAVVIGYTKKVKFPEKTAAREQLMKHFGLYDLDNSQKPAPSVNMNAVTVKLDFEDVRARVQTALGPKAGSDGQRETDAEAANREEGKTAPTFTNGGPHHPGKDS